MKKLAVFVEGLTEQLFMAKLFTEVAGSKNIVIESQKACKTTKGNRSFRPICTISASSAATDQKYYVLIRDCSGESTVKTDIRDCCEDMAKKKFEKILGLRDVAPSYSRPDIPMLEKLLAYGLPTRFIPICMLLAVMECEAWFLAETTHYARIDSNITLEAIVNLLSFDPSIENVEERESPAEDLNKIYRLAGKAYKKDFDRISRTVNALDYCYIYFDLRGRVTRLGAVIDEIDTFLQ